MLLENGQWHPPHGNAGLPRSDQRGAALPGQPSAVERGKTPAGDQELDAVAALRRATSSLKDLGGFPAWEVQEHNFRFADDPRIDVNALPFDRSGSAPCAPVSVPTPVW